MQGRGLGLAGLLAAAVLAGVAGSAGAGQNCYEGIGCASTERFDERELRKLGCEPLRDVRNWIFKERGYCFKTPKAIADYGNDGCIYDDEALVPKNDYERDNVIAIRKVEAEKGCK